MNRDSRSINISEDVKRLSQYEKLYARLIYPVDAFQKEGYLSSNLFFDI